MTSLEDSEKQLPQSLNSHALIWPPNTRFTKPADDWVGTHESSDLCGLAIDSLCIVTPLVWINQECALRAPYDKNLGSKESVHPNSVQSTASSCDSTAPRFTLGVSAITANPSCQSTWKVHHHRTSFVDSLFEGDNLVRLEGSPSSSIATHTRASWEADMLLMRRTGRDRLAIGLGWNSSPNVPVWHRPAASMVSPILANSGHLSSNRSWKLEDVSKEPVNRTINTVPCEQDWSCARPT